MNIVEARIPILILSYHNCELYCCHLDGYQSNTDALFRRLAEIETQFLNKPVHAQFRIWYNIDKSRLEKSTMKRIAESIGRVQKHIYKIAFIGLYGMEKWKFNYILEQTLGKNKIYKAYFLDAELAKEWLV